MAAGTMKTAVAEMEAEAAAKIKVTVAECFIVFRCIFCAFCSEGATVFSKIFSYPGLVKVKCRMNKVPFMLSNKNIYGPHCSSNVIKISFQ